MNCGERKYRVTFFRFLLLILRQTLATFSSVRSIARELKSEKCRLIANLIHRKSKSCATSLIACASTRLHRLRHQSQGECKSSIDTHAVFEGSKFTSICITNETGFVSQLSAAHHLIDNGKLSYRHCGYFASFRYRRGRLSPSISNSSAPQITRCHHNFLSFTVHARSRSLNEVIAERNMLMQSDLP